MMKTMRHWAPNKYWAVVLSLCTQVLGWLYLARPGMALAYLSNEPFRIPSLSMYPNYKPGDIVVAQKYGYGNYQAYGMSLLKTPLSQPLLRGEVIIFNSPKRPEYIFAKRIIALPGDVLSYQQTQLLLNQRQLTRELQYQNAQSKVYLEQLDEEAYLIRYLTQHAAFQGSVVVPAGHVFVMGDNRDNSQDSRSWGMLPVGHIIGKVVLKFTPY